MSRLPSINFLALPSGWRLLAGAAEIPAWFLFHCSWMIIVSWVLYTISIPSRSNSGSFTGGNDILEQLESNQNSLQVHGLLSVLGQPWLLDGRTSDSSWRSPRWEHVSPGQAGSQSCFATLNCVASVFGPFAPTEQYDRSLSSSACHLNSMIS